jgi:excisionase family DNA binding protein
MITGGFMKLMTYKELSKELALSIRYLQKLVKQGSLPYIRFGRAIRFDPEGISKWINKQNQSSTDMADTAG